MNILDFIPKGKENAINKETLCNLTGLNERDVRSAIKRAVECGEPVLSSSGHKGYWYSEDIDEIEEFIRENDHRSNAITKTTAKLKKHLYEMKNIKVTPVRHHYRRLDNGELEGQMSMEEYIECRS